MRASAIVLALSIIASGSAVHAQAIPQPTNPVLFCGIQATPNADSYQVVVNGGSPSALSMQATVDTRCPAGTTHSFTLPASLFTIGKHSVQVLATNVFGTTAGPVYAVTVGIAPGTFTINAVVG